ERHDGPTRGLLAHTPHPWPRHRSCGVCGNGKPSAPRVGRAWPLAGMLVRCRAKVNRTGMVRDILLCMKTSFSLLGPTYAHMGRIVSTSCRDTRVDLDRAGLQLDWSE